MKTGIYCKQITEEELKMKDSIITKLFFTKSKSLFCQISVNNISQQTKINFIVSEKSGLKTKYLPNLRDAIDYYNTL